MKRFLNVVLRIKIQACILFSATVVVALAVSLFLPDWSLTETILWQDLLICFVGSLLQWLAYSPHWRSVSIVIPRAPRWEHPKVSSASPRRGVISRFEIMAANRP